MSSSNIDFSPRFNECSCNLCARMCVNSPCFPTPEDVKNLVKAGYRDSLSHTIYVDQRTLLWYEGVAPIKLDSGCVFLENNLCILHESGLKPTEGKILNHIDSDNSEVRIEILKTWDSAEGEAIIDEFNEGNDDGLIKKLSLLGVKKGEFN